MAKKCLLKGKLFSSKFNISDRLILRFNHYTVSKYEVKREIKRGMPWVVGDF